MGEKRRGQPYHCAVNLNDFDFDLPKELIAQRPPEKRSAGRLLAVDIKGDDVEDSTIARFPAFLNPNDLLVLNDTRVIPARLAGRKQTGGQVEMLVERVLGEDRFSAQIKASKSPRPGTRISVEPAGTLEVVARYNDIFELRSLDSSIEALLNASGQVPLPPYVTRRPDGEDMTRYQTIFARRPGAVAAPTAGLHLDQELLDEIAGRGVEIRYLTLHVGAGTFQPVRVLDFTTHRMHAERYEVTAELCEAVRATKSRGGRVVAVGTTVVRSLESAVNANGDLQPTSAETRLFIYPGYKFRVVDALLTNFHVPKSSLIMLVSAFGGYERVMAAYRHAVINRYRFFSYGDAMWLYARSR